MSSLRLLFSGSLVASGLILGAFTLHGAFEPGAAQKAQKQSQTAGQPKGIAAFRTRTRFESGTEHAGAKAPLLKTSAKPEAKPASKSADAPADKAKAAKAEARRKRAEKKRAEKEKAEREKLAKAGQDASLQQAKQEWPWNWLGN
jgi:hypothetical protein